VLPIVPDTVAEWMCDPAEPVACEFVLPLFVM
jgi:hypothetical protein